MKNNSRNSLLVVVLVALIIPILVALMMEINVTWVVETDNDWIGFYASYIGSIIGVFGVFAVTKIDQRKREEEKNDELFLNNISTYRELSRILSIENLINFKKELSIIKDEDNWQMIDSYTKGKIKQIESNLYYSDESNGLISAVSSFIRNNLYDELKVTMYSSEDEFNESIEYQDIPSDSLKQFAIIVINNSNIELKYNAIVHNTSYEELREVSPLLGSRSGLTTAEDSIETVAIKLSELVSS